MSENKNKNNEEMVEKQETANETEDSGTEIVIAETGKVKKVIKWALGGLALIATAIGGIILGKNLGNDDSDDSDSSSDSSESTTETTD